MKEVIYNTAKKVFKDNLVNVSTGVLDKETLFLKIYIAPDEKAFINNISHNDPLSLIVRIEGGVVDFVQKSISINPESKYYAYSSHKFNVRKFKFKDESDLDKKLVKALEKIKAEGRELVKQNMFTVYDSYPKVKKAIEKTFK